MNEVSFDASAAETITLSVEEDFVAKQTTKSDPILALSELIWNSLDADATAQIEDKSEWQKGDGIIRQLVSNAVQQEKLNHIDRLDEELLDFAITDLRRNSRSKTRHTGKRAGDHR